MQSTIFSSANWVSANREDTELLYLYLYHMGEHYYTVWRSA